MTQHHTSLSMTVSRCDISTVTLAVNCHFQADIQVAVSHTPAHDVVKWSVTATDFNGPARLQAVMWESGTSEFPTCSQQFFTWRIVYACRVDYSQLSIWRSAILGEFHFHGQYRSMFPPCEAMCVPYSLSDEPPTKSLVNRADDIPLPFMTVRRLWRSSKTSVLLLDFESPLLDPESPTVFTRGHGPFRGIQSRNGFHLTCLIT